MGDICEVCGGDPDFCDCEYCPRCGIKTVEKDEIWCDECRAD